DLIVTGVQTGALPIFFWWNSGPISERLNGGTEQLVLDRITNLMTGPWPLLVAAIVMLALARHNRLMKLSLVAVPLLGTQVFFNRSEERRVGKDSGAVL